MFDPKKAFRELSGHSFTHAEFRRALERIRAANLRYLPAEYGTKELADLAHQKHWLKSEAPGRLKVVVR
ncbi:MAG TPA: hypothetical protein VN577_08720 [Terriglobales bacterium]|nr:hypothetical protein [Terriglobales bacterium]